MSFCLIVFRLWLIDFKTLKKGLRKFLSIYLLVDQIIALTDRFVPGAVETVTPMVTCSER
jgi:hypothetical protein